MEFLIDTTVYRPEPEAANLHSNIQSSISTSYRILHGVLANNWDEMDR